MAANIGLPPARAGAAAAYAGGSKIVMFGGASASGEALDDTWLFDITDPKGWTKLDLKPDQRPPGRAFAQLGYNGQRAILFGGGAGSLLNDTWAFDGKSWTELKPKHKPMPRRWFGMAAEGPIGAQRIVLFGGDNGGQAPLGDTWIFYGGEWTEMALSPSPSPRWSPGMCDVGNNAQAALFAGTAHIAPYADTWFYDDTPEWINFDPSPSPDLRTRHSMAEAPEASGWQFMLFGGYRDYDKKYYDDTWGFEWNPNGGAWHKYAGSGPSARADACMAYVQGGGVNVLFGGANAGTIMGDTWLFDQNNWQLWSPGMSLPPTRLQKHAHSGKLGVAVSTA